MLNDPKGTFSNLSMPETYFFFQEIAFFVGLLEFLFVRLILAKKNIFKTCASAVKIVIINTLQLV
jgi:hypothetical protein